MLTIPVQSWAWRPWQIRKKKRKTRCLLLKVHESSLAVTTFWRCCCCYFCYCFNLWFCVSSVEKGETVRNRWHAPFKAVIEASQISYRCYLVVTGIKFSASTCGLLRERCLGCCMSQFRIWMQKHILRVIGLSEEKKAPDILWNLLKNKDVYRSRDLNVQENWKRLGKVDYVGCRIY